MFTILSWSLVQDKAQIYGAPVVSAEKGWMGGWVDGWMDDWIGGWMDGWMDDWIGGWMDG